MKRPRQPRLLNRELAWLSFNERVLDEATDATVPLLDRVRFLAIFSSNLDEFFMVRFAGIWRLIDAGITTPGPEGMTPREALAAVAQRARELVARQHRLFLDLVPDLAANGVHLLRPNALTPDQQAAASAFFHGRVFPLLTPMAIDPGHPFPSLGNRAIALMARLAPDPTGPLPGVEEAVLHVPGGALPRFVPVPAGTGEHAFVLLEDVIRMHLDAVFRGVRVKSCHAVRVTRDAELDFDDDADDLLAAVEDAVRARRLGAAVRLQYEAALPAEALSRLRSELELDEHDLYATDGPTGLTDLIQLVDAVDRPDLREPPFSPRRVPSLMDEDPFETLRRGDVLVHHPYEDFGAVEAFIEAAASDPSVVALKMTLYRVDAGSRIGAALERAAILGKQVVALVELRARFSEEGNIAWARRLDAIGAHVVYGLQDKKTHCKAALVLRQEAGGLRAYCHLGTGNYNARTARAYTDLSLLSANPDLGAEVGHLFNLLTGYVEPPPLAQLVLAPLDLRRWLLERFAAEAEAARSGRPAGIMAVLNNVADPAVIEALYAASAAGVRIRLLVRGTCCLRPAVAGLSSHIEVRRIVDRYLEHARVLRFDNGGTPVTYLTSADWMTRNLDGRVECAFPVRDAALADRIEKILALQWSDNVKADRIGPDGRGRRIPRAGRAVRSQIALQRR
jgi:polyphosphate kinase